MLTDQGPKTLKASQCGGKNDGGAPDLALPAADPGGMGG